MDTHKNANTSADPKNHQFGRHFHSTTDDSGADIDSPYQPVKCVRLLQYIRCKTTSV